MKIVLVVFVVSGATVFGEDIDFKRSRVDFVADHGDIQMSRLTDRANAKSYDMPSQSARAKFWISPSLGVDGYGALGIGFGNYSGCDTKQRGELEIRSSKMNEEVYHSFSVYIHPNSRPLRGQPMFTQIWQNHDTSAPKRPPFALAFSEQGYHWVVKTSRAGLNPKGEQVTAFRSPQALAKGRWHRFVVRFKPSVKKTGAFAIWLDDVPVVSQTHQRDFGYAVSNQAPVVLNQFVTRIGAYRGRQKCPKTPVDNYNEMYVLFDKVKFGSSFAEVQ